MKRSTFLAACAALLALGLARPAPAAVSSQQQTVNDAAATVREMRAESGIARSGLLQRARAVLIVPRAFSAAFGVGAEGGQAVLLVRNGRGWSDPAFYNVAAVSAGLQLGGRETSSVLLIMTERALRSFLQDSNITVGAQANLTTLRFDANRVAELGGADIVVWSKSEGLFVGGSLQAQGFTQNTGNDQAYYGRPVTAADIARGAVHNPGSRGLKAAL